MICVIRSSLSTAGPSVHIILVFHIHAPPYKINNNILPHIQVFFNYYFRFFDFFSINEVISEVNGTVSTIPIVPAIPFIISIPMEYILII